MKNAYPQNQNPKIFYNNYFTSLPLLSYLAQQGIHSLGTVRRNRIPNCKPPVDFDMREKEREYSIEQVTDFKSILEISLVTWNDNRPVSVMSTFAGENPIETIAR